MLSRKEPHRSFDSSFWRGLITASFLSVAACFAFSGHAEAHGWHHHRHHHYRVVHRWHHSHWRHHYRHYWHRPHTARAWPRSAYRYEARVAARSSDILATAERYLGDRNPTHHQGQPWCAYFLQMILHRLGYYTNGSGRAIDSRLLGPPTRPHPGAIAYLPHHTAFVAKVRNGRVLLLGGNQQHHRVTFMWHSMRGMRFIEPVRMAENE